ncbi:SEC-C domain-containing protein [Saccharopolyspora hirsuta]|uniref:SEC-C domain-containing protein n=1 Tax=Saccharopolyspora hirsuta TaxID=1837 RepID=A0A5M7C4W8_SACHI|nr:SEC-C domain-containing protein [Saccharopolyspora hirsuta]KAA5836843.1 SEC-C domain-containing protein [Saccharopolyspora hirsuta]
MAAPPTEARRRQLNIEYAEALEADAEISGQRCDDLVEAAGYWHFAEEHEREEQALATAAEIDDGHNVLSGRAAYASFLLTHGRLEEGERAMAQLMREGSECPWAYGEAAAGYHAIGAQQEALRWLNIGVQRFIPDVDAAVEVGDPGFELLRERAELRRELGLPQDQYDELHARSQERSHEVYAQIEEVSRQRQAATAVLYWPEAEFAEVQRRYPTWYPDTAHVEHRREVQRSLGHHPGAVIATGELDALLAFAESRERPPDEPSTRAEFAAEAARLGRTVPWPPGRNDHCWCGAGRKYKKCCGAPGFA